ncbi:MULTISPECIES: C1 family peptidase [unclassified Spirosoma]|uniref:C1 family peptidase n=1 Tax=unclassified Spirosoma TaxID=2621999 RepID=UPI000960B19F|nr:MULTISPECIES: C1 family peptidase [unclassified Spirosoma]MBN8821491.1 hypothetical protein [Spirosoma sp.]OJW78271.1 MAG: hypothetical protein BGO59_30125 [Spirosoma sp. 48-14]
MKRIALVFYFCCCTVAVFAQIHFLPPSKPALNNSTDLLSNLQPRQQPTASRTLVSQPLVHVIYVEEQNELEFARVNMENDSLIAQVINKIANGLSYQIQNWRIPKDHFTSQTLKETVLSLQTNPKDIIIVYFSGYGISPSAPAKLANWRLDDVTERGLAVSELETWLNAQKAHLSLILADYKTETTQREGAVSGTVIYTINLEREILKRLFIQNCGVVQFGSSLTPKSRYMGNGAAGTLFTNAFNKAFLSILDNTRPTDLSTVSFQWVQAITEIYVPDSNQSTILDINPCSAQQKISSNPVAIQPSGASSRGAQWQGFRVDDDRYNQLQQKPILKLKTPRAVDLSKYTPPVVNQGQEGMCVAVAIGYYMRSTLEAIKLNLTDKAAIQKHSFSPSYLYNFIKDAGDVNCSFGIFAESALDFCQKYGLASFSSYPNVNACTDVPTNKPEPNSKILDYVKLFSITDDKADKVLATKQALAERSPVVIGMELTPSIGHLSFSRLFFTKLQNSVMQLVSSDTAPPAIQWKPDLSNTLDFGHAMCVVGYDDNMLGQGAFKLINSWGKNWGDGGFFWITYENFARFAKYGYQAYLPANTSAVVLSADVSLYHALSPSTPLSATTTQYGRSVKGYTLAKSLPTGTSLRLAIKTTTQSYLYALAANSTDSVITTLFPSGTFAPLVSANTLIDVTKDSLLTLSGDPGTEYMLFIFSNERLTNLDAIRHQLQTQPGTFPERVGTVFNKASQLIQRNRLVYKAKKTGFFCYSDPSMKGQAYTVPVLIRINHVNNLRL